MSSFKEGVHYYFDESGRMVLTTRYLLERGYCCKNGCRHCPYPDVKPIIKDEPAGKETNRQKDN